MGVQVLEDMMDPLPKPETVPLHPVRVLVEKAFHKGFIMKFNIRKGVDHTYNVDAYICLYLLARCSSAVSSYSTILFILIMQTAFTNSI